MNFRITSLLFALLLATLWIFGLMIASKKSAVDQSPIVPTLATRDANVDKVVIKVPESKDKKAAAYEFVNIGDRWYYKEGKQQVRVEGSRIKEMIDAITNARPDENADLPKDLSAYGLTSPQLTVVLSGKLKDEPKDWSFFVGKESPDAVSFYVNSNERPEKAHLVPKRSIERLFVSNPNNLRAKRLFDPTEAQVKTIEILKGAKKLEIKRGEGNVWLCVEPKNIGMLGFDTAAPEDKMPEDKFHPKEKEKKKDEAPSGVKILLSAIMKASVENDEDFVPLGGSLADYELEDKKAPMRIEISTSDDGKATNKDTLLVGKQVPGRKDVYYYARLAADDGIFMLPEKTIKPIDKAVEKPEDLRSHDIAAFDPKNIDYFTFTHKDEEVKFTTLDKKPWEMFFVKEKKKDGDVLEMKKTNDPAVDKMVEHLVGKKAIVDFIDVPEADLKAKLAEFGLDKPAVEITLYANAIDKDKDKKDEKDKKDDKTKKDEKKTEPDKNKMPDLKKDPKATLKLEFGKVVDDKVYVRRTLDNGGTNLFTVKKEFLDKILPGDSIELAYLDTVLPHFMIQDVMSMSIVGNTEKGTETLDLVAGRMNGQDVWYVKDKKASAGEKLAESKAASGLVVRFGNLAVTKWVKTLDDKEDLEKYGLKKPAAVVTFRVVKPAEDWSTALGLVASEPGMGFLTALSAVAGRHQTPKGVEEITFELGKEATDEPKDKEKEKEKGKGKEKEKIGVYAKRTGAKMLFVVPIELLKYVKDTDFRDRASSMNVQARMVASQLAFAAGDPYDALLLTAPFFGGQVVHLDADKVKDIKLTVRTRYELRNFHFERVGKDKDKTWVDKTGLQEFQIDQDKVNRFVKEFSKVHSDRFVAFTGGPRDEHKLGAKEATARIEMTTEDGKSVTLTIGARYQTHGYYATSSYWPGTVFMLPFATVDPILAGPEQFAKERAGVD